MQASILIVSKDRKQELAKTLLLLENSLDFSIHEVLVFLDGCTDDSKELLEKFSWARWFYVDKSIGASGARNKLYLNAKGHCLIGFDDDAHPLHIDFVKRTIAVFEQNPKAGIVAFEEIKGVFNSDEDALKSVDAGLVEYVTNDFIGSGFAISKEAYNATNGFPLWMDIYGEESCVALEVLSKGYDILYTNKIKVNHRVDIEKRKLCKQNYYRFGKQLKNSTYYFLVYYPFPLYPILKLYWHNLRKYALTDWECCKIYFKTLLTILINFPCILKYRNPVEKSLILKMRKLTELKF